MGIRDKINSIWADCELVGVIGNGSFGTVYHVKIRDQYGNHSYAVKMIKFPSNELEARRFKRKEYKQKYYRQMIESYRDEVDTMMKLKNYDNVVQIIDYAIVEESLGYSIFIRMELLTPLNQKLKSGNISENEIIKLGIDLCTGLEVCKNIGIIHGDIKYDNILVSSSGKYKLSDFGVCLKISCEHQYSIQNRGGANTSPPELVKKGIFNWSTDTYSLGLVLYKLLNNDQLPFFNSSKVKISKKDMDAATKRRLNGELLPRPIDASDEFYDLILKACAYDPKRRFRNPSEMKRALQDLSKGRYKKSDLHETNIELNNGGKSMRYKDVHEDTEMVINRAEPTATGVDYFGRRSTFSTVVITVLVMLMLGGGGFFVYNKLINKDDNTSVEETSSQIAETSFENENGVFTEASTVVYSDYDNDQISAVITEADKLANNGDLAGAKLKVENALMTYPDSDELSAKAKEYSDSMDHEAKQKAKDSTLSDASKKAESGDYLGAIKTIKTALINEPDDSDYNEALDSYKDSYKTSLIADADALSDDGKYLDAIKKVKEGNSVLGNDSEIETKITGYEALFVSDAVSKADNSLANKDYDSADKVIDEALKEFPTNQNLKDEKAKIDKSRPLSSEQIFRILDKNKISDSGTYASYSGATSINVFAKDETNCFSINTAASFNMWGGGTQMVSFRIDDLNMDTLNLKICGETGTSDAMSVNVYVDITDIDNANPNYIYDFDAPYPVDASINIKDATTLTFVVINHTSHTNRIAFYDFNGN